MYVYQDSKPLLRSMICTLRGESNFVSVCQRINGIIGSANTIDITITSPRQLAVLLRKRFVSRTDLEDIIGHDDFETFLFSRAYEIIDKRS